MSNSSANRTLFSINLSERPLGLHCVAGAFASYDKSRTACRAGRSPMLRNKLRSVLALLGYRIFESTTASAVSEN